MNESVKKIPFNKKIKATLDDYVSNDMFGPVEAIAAAVDKFMLKRLFEERRFLRTINRNNKTTEPIHICNLLKLQIDID